MCSSTSGTRSRHGSTRPTTCWGTARPLSRADGGASTSCPAIRQELTPPTGGATETTWTWRDLNGNRVYDRGEVNLDPNGPDFLRSRARPIRAQPEREAAPDRRVLDDLRAGADAEFGVRATGIYSRNFNQYRLQNNRPYDVYNIPITNLDPGPDGRAAPDDPGTSVTYYDFPAWLQGARSWERRINDPSAEFKSIEVSGHEAAGRRLAAVGGLLGHQAQPPVHLQQQPGPEQRRGPVRDESKCGDLRVQ